MSTVCTESETMPRTGMIAALGNRIRKQISYALLVTELRGLSPPLLADLGIARWEIPQFARAAVWGGKPDRSGQVDGPATTIGSDTWCRAYMIRLGG